MERKALGRGLNALIPEADALGEKNILNVNIDNIKPNPFQPRQDFNAENIEELKNSIKEKGLIQPILVRNKGAHYEIIAGERRWRAAKALNFPEVSVIVKDAKDQEALELALIENIHRQDLNPIEEAFAYKKLADDFSLTQEEIARLAGKSRVTVTNVLRLLNLPLTIQEQIKSGNISSGHAKVLLELESDSDKDELAKLIISKSLSVRELENLVKQKRPVLKRKFKALPATNLDLQLTMLEELLQQYLGTKVKIIRSKKRGHIQIEFYSTEDLERIIKVIKNDK